MLKKINDYAPTNFLRSSNNSLKCTSVFARCYTASECFEFLLKVITIMTQLQTCYRSFEFVVPMILVVSFMGNAIKYFQEPLASVLFCMDDHFYPRIFGMFSKIAVFLQV